MDGWMDGRKEGTNTITTTTTTINTTTNTNNTTTSTTNNTTTNNNTNTTTNTTTSKTDLARATESFCPVRPPVKVRKPDAMEEVNTMSHWKAGKPLSTWRGSGTPGFCRP